MHTNDPLLTQEQAADVLGVKPGTLEVWRTTKRYSLAYIKVGRNVRYQRSALDAFIAARRVSA